MSEDAENINEIREIPIEVTSGKLVYIESRLDDGPKRELFGKLGNPPIEVGKFIDLTRCHTTAVTSIWMEDGIYIIETESGEIYCLDPEKLPSNGLKPADDRGIN